MASPFLFQYAAPRSPDPFSTPPRVLKKHKALPHSRTMETADQPPPRPMPDASPTMMSGLPSQQRYLRSHSSPLPPPPTLPLPLLPRTLQGTAPRSHRVRSGPEPPPTPPTQSRHSSSSHSTRPSSRWSDSASAIIFSLHDPVSPAVLYPPNNSAHKNSPPTPSVTPPLPPNRPSALRPVLANRADHADHTYRVDRTDRTDRADRPDRLDRGASRGTTTESRTESFKTAPEEPYSSEDDTLRTVLPVPSLESNRSSHTTVRQSPATDHPSSEKPAQASPFDRPAVTSSASPRSHPHSYRHPDLDWFLLTSRIVKHQHPAPQPAPYSPALRFRPAKKPFLSFDGGYTSGSSDVEQEWDDYLQRQVTVKKRKKQPPEPLQFDSGLSSDDVVENTLVTPTNAAKAVRAMTLLGRTEVVEEDIVVATPVTIPSHVGRPTSHPVAAHRLTITKPTPPATATTAATTVATTTANATTTTPMIAPMVASTTAPTSAATTTAVPGHSSGPHNSNSTISLDVRRFSSMSAKSAVSSVVEAILVDSAPTRQKTLRHVPKVVALRAAAAPEPSRSPLSDQDDDEAVFPWLQKLSIPVRRDTGRHGSYASTSTTNSISSRSARREVWRNGGIPVVVVPDRRSSFRPKSIHTPSLRSTSSRRSSSRSASLGSIRQPLLHVNVDAATPGVRGRPSSPTSGPAPSRARAARARSESEGSQRTIDYPPMIPKRSSSLSAPTSRSTSRAGSMTADSAGVRLALFPQQHQQFQYQHNKQGRILSDSRISSQLPTDLALVESEINIPQLRLLAAEPAGHGLLDYDNEASRTTVGRLPVAVVDRSEDPNLDQRLSVQRLSVQLTPFSLASSDTNGTFTELSQAKAVTIFPHQNSSVLMVRQSARQSESSDSQTTYTRKTRSPPEPLIVKSASPDMDIPATPPGAVTPPAGSAGPMIVDSPLRNPRSAPVPPTHLAPAVVRTAANASVAVTFEPNPSWKRRYFSSNQVDHIGLRAASGGSKAEGGLSMLRRALSLSKGPSPPYSRRESERAAYATNTTNEVLFPETGKRHGFGPTPDPPVHQSQHESQPVVPRRTLSRRLKQAFNVLPPDSDGDPDDCGDGNGAEYGNGDGNDRLDDRYEHDEREPGRRSGRVEMDVALERRQVRRTPSGSLRTMKRHDSSGPRRSPGRYEAPVRTLYLAEKTRMAAAAAATTTVRAIEEKAALAPSPAQTASVRGTTAYPASVSPPVSRPSGVGAGSGGLLGLQRRLSERRRERRSQELRGKISGPMEFRDGVDDILRPGRP